MTLPDGVQLTADLDADPQLAALVEEVLTPDAVALLADLHRRFNGRRLELLAARNERDARLASGGTLDFLPETAQVREDPSWRVVEPGPGLVDRRVEITGPTDQKMTINALNSGAKVWLADFEAPNTPPLVNMLGGQRNLRAAITRSIDFESGGKSYALGEEVATIVVRPRGWHLPEKHLVIDGDPMSGSLFDFGLYLFHSGRLQVENGLGPYFYLPKMESHLEARLWNDVFVAAQEAVGPGQRPCHKRGAHAIGGMAAFIPNRRDPEKNEKALAKVREDKTREAGDGFDGSWVAHPDLVPVCKEVFDSVLGERPNQLDRLREEVSVTAEQLLDVRSTPGDITEGGLRNNVSVGLQYLEAWLRGSGAVAIFGLMEDAATAEISRSQVWQWYHLEVELSNGEKVTKELVNRVIDEELAKIRETVGEEAYGQ